MTNALYKLTKLVCVYMLRRSNASNFSALRHILFSIAKDVVFGEHSNLEHLPNPCHH